MFCLHTSSHVSRPKFEFALKVKVMGSNPGYLLKSFLLYFFYQDYEDSDRMNGYGRDVLKLSRPKFEFSLKVKVMESNQGYLLKSFPL